MKRNCAVLVCVALVLAVAVLSFGTKFFVPAYAMDEFATPTDLDEIDDPWPMSIVPEVPLEISLDKDEYGLLTLVPQDNGIYTFTVQTGDTEAGAQVNITLYDTTGNNIPVYFSEYDALSKTNGQNNADLSYFSSPIALLCKNEMVRILVRLNWEYAMTEPCDDQSSTIMITMQPFEGNYGDELYWSLNPKTMTLTISGSGSMPVYSSNDYPWNLAIQYIQHIILDEGVSSISSYAFASSYVLEDIVIPDSLTRIENAAFYWSGIKNLTLRSSVTDISSTAFSGLSSGFTLHCEVGSAAQAVAQAKGIPYTYIPFANTLTLPEDTVTIESKAFANLGEHVNIVIPAGTTSIATDAFDGSTVLLLVVQGSSAATFAEAQQIPYLYVE